MTALSTMRSRFRLEAFLVGLVSVVILILRTRHSINKLPADPGYDYIYSAATTGIGSWFNLDPYIHFGAHFLSWVVSLLPLQNQAAALTLLNHFIWSLCSIGIYVALKEDGIGLWSRWCGALSLVIIPVAAESGLGNVGNVKWPLITLALVFCSSEAIFRFSKTSEIVLILTGFTNPLLAVALVPLALRYKTSDQSARRKLMLPAATVCVTFLIQLIVVGFNSLGSGRGDSRILSPWPGMGIFWWYGLLGPILLSVGFLALNHGFHFGPRSQVMTRISLTVPVLTLTSYFYGGIADRYFIAPMALSWITSTFLAVEVGKSSTQIPRILVCGTIFIGFVVPAAKWFSSSWYLTSGPMWTDEITRAVDSCRSGKVSEVLQIGAGNQTELSCDYILQDS